MFLTNMRIILQNEKTKEKFKGMSIKNYKVYEERYISPKFAQNYFFGYIQTYNKLFPKDLQFKIWLNPTNGDFFKNWLIQKKES